MCLQNLVPRNGIVWGNRTTVLRSRYQDRRFMIGLPKPMKNKKSLEEALVEVFRIGRPILRDFNDKGTVPFLQAFSDVADKMPWTRNIPLLFIIQIFFAALAGQTLYEAKRPTFPHNFMKLCPLAREIHGFKTEMGEHRLLSLRLDYLHCEDESIDKLDEAENEGEELDGITGAERAEPGALDNSKDGDDPANPQGIFCYSSTDGYAPPGGVPRANTVAVQMSWKAPPADDNHSPSELIVDNDTGSQGVYCYQFTGDHEPPSGVPRADTIAVQMDWTAPPADSDRGALSFHHQPFGGPEP